MSSPLDPVSGPLYFLGFMGGFPLEPVNDSDKSDWDWDNCSMFKKSPCRLAWCYIAHFLVMAGALAIMVACLLQEASFDYLFSFGENGMWIKYGMSATDGFIVFGLMAIMFLNIYVYIYQLYDAEEGLSNLCYSVSRISGTLISDGELNGIAKKNKKELLITVLILWISIPSLQIPGYYSIYYEGENFNLGRVIAVSISITFLSNILVMSAPHMAGFLIFKQCADTTKVMIRNYSTQLSPHLGMSQKMIRQLKHDSLLPDEDEGDHLSLSSTGTGTLFASSNKRRIPNLVVISDVDTMLEYGNDLADILEQLRVAFNNLLCNDVIIVVIVGVCNLYVALSTLLILMMTTPKALVFNVCIMLAYVIFGSVYIYKLLSLVSSASSLEVEVENMWEFTGEAAVHKFRNMMPQHVFELNALRERIKHMMKNLITPKGFFHLSKGLVVGIFSTIIGYFLILVGFRTEEIKKLIENGGPLAPK